jgi:hypothetical protein
VWWTAWAVGLAGIIAGFVVNTGCAARGPEENPP